MPLELGEVVVPLVLPGELVLLPDVAPLALPLVPLPLVMFSSRRHFSRSSPVMPRHLLLVLPVAPVELLPVALGEEVEELLLPVALGVELELAPALLSVEVLPVADGLLLPVVAPTLDPLLVPPVAELELCAEATPASAKSAAAVATPTTLNIGEDLLGVGEYCGPFRCNDRAWHASSLYLSSMQIRPLQVGVAAALASAAFVQQRVRRAERMYPPTGHFIHVDGVRMHYLERGEGTPLVMLHGNGSMGRELELSGLYELAAARYRLIVPDRPGHGYSARPRHRWWGPLAQAALMRDMLAQLGIERPIIFGHSYGALVALAFGLEYPGLARSLVLASGYYFPTGRLDIPLMAPPAIPVLGDLMRYTVSPLISRALLPLFKRRVFAPAPVPRYFEQFPDWLALRPSQLRAAAEEVALLVPSVLRLQQLYRALEVPALVVAGAQDRHVDHVRHSVALARALPHGELMFSPRAGHMVHHTDPRRVLQAIEAAAAR